jgi:hypothetical protein
MTLFVHLQQVDRESIAESPCVRGRTLSKEMGEKRLANDCRRVVPCRRARGWLDKKGPDNGKERGVCRRGEYRGQGVFRGSLWGLDTDFKRNPGGLSLTKASMTHSATSPIAHPSDFFFPLLPACPSRIPFHASSTALTRSRHPASFLPFRKVKGGTGGARRMARFEYTRFSSSAGVRPVGEGPD